MHTAQWAVTISPTNRTMSTPAAYVLPVLLTTCTSSNLGIAFSTLEIVVSGPHLTPNRTRFLICVYFGMTGCLSPLFKWSQRTMQGAAMSDAGPLAKPLGLEARRQKKSLGTAGMMETQIGVVVEYPEDASDAGT